MNWQNIINNAGLIYTSTPDDKMFRTWSLKRTTCDVLFYEIYPTENIDKIICGIIDSNDGIIEESKIATMLGFNVIDNFEVSPKRYADNAELDVFKAIISPLLSWGLVIREGKTNFYSLTHLGKRALERGEKYIFYSGKKVLFENWGINSQNHNDSLFFPYYQSLGLYSEITNRKQIKYNEINLTEVFEIEKSDLVKRYKLQSKELYHIYDAQITSYFEIKACDVDIRLYKQNDEYFPIVFYNNHISVESTELFYKSENTSLKEKKIEWGLYLKLIKDPNAVLDYQTIIPFEDLLDYNTLVKDTRLVWQDEKLFLFIAERANANQWHSISTHCPLEVIKTYIGQFKEQWDWINLSLRIDDQFLIENATKFPWDFESISAKEDISIDIIKTLLLIPELKEQEWDWDSIMPQLDFDFIKTNISHIDFEFSELTKVANSEIHQLITQYPQKAWNWQYISSEYDLSFIVNNVLCFSTFLSLKTIINRAFTSENHVDVFCKSIDFKEVLIQYKDSELRSYSPNKEEYIWSTDLIDLLESTNYLTWESGAHTLGFECNPFINWEYDYFEKYHSKIVTEKGYSFVSQKIQDARIISDYPNFNWNWNTISTNTNLINNKEFVLLIANKLDFSRLLHHINSDVLEALLEKADTLNFLEANPDYWLRVTEKATIDFVRHHLDYNWSWAILTRRFCSSIKVEALGNPRWIEKWDWDYLTQNIDIHKIYDNIDLYVDYWNWEHLTKELDKSFIIDNLPEYNDYWDWQILLSSRLTREDLLEFSTLLEVATCISVLEEDLQENLWVIITRKFECADLESLVKQTNFVEYKELFKWDYLYFYELPAFNLRNYLDNYGYCVNWEKLSCCNKLNSELFFDKSLFDYKTWINDVFRILGNANYQWDFKELSKINNINWCDDVLEQYITLWDWEYLSLNSSCFRQSDAQIKRVSTFQKYINFAKFSERNDNAISEGLIKKFIKYEWNWQALSQNSTIQYTAEFLYKNERKDWDWQALSDKKITGFDNETLLLLSEKQWDWNLISERKDIKFTEKTNEKFLIEALIDKPLNWEAISRRNDVTFSEEIIRLLKDKPLNWEFVSKSESFVPNAKTLSLLKSKVLDWSLISTNEHITTDIFEDYKEKINWFYLTRNKQFEISNSELLLKYQEYVDWEFISSSEEFVLSVINLRSFKNKLNWDVINKRKDFAISEDLLNFLADVLDWSLVSQSMAINITEELIEKYRNYWDWQLLRENSQVIDRLESTFKKYKAEFNCMDFVESFKGQPYIYHFTHLFNAIDIIKSRKILSRNKAEGHFSNSAGNLVARRNTAHNFARFYYRPQTLTQFYNECLGKDRGNEYYQKALRLGLPKCPMPIFFKFDLKEVILRMSNKCFYSTGNMQTNWASVIKVEENPYELNTTCLYYNMDYAYSYAKANCGGYNPSYFRTLMSQYRSDCKQYSQQEFLVSEEFDFADLNSFEIICYDNEQANILKSQLGDDPICKKINTNNSGIFHRGNSKLNIQDSENEIFIQSDYQDRAYLSIRGKGLKHITILNPDNIQKETATEIIAYPEIKFTKTEQPIEVHFVDTSIGTREWLIYKV